MPQARARRKAELLAESDRLRDQLTARTAALLGPTQWAKAAAARSGEIVRQPLFLGAVVVAVAAIGPRRILAGLRWGLLTLPGHPLGRRALAVLGTLVADAASRSSVPKD